MKAHGRWWRLRRALLVSLLAWLAAHLLSGGTFAQTADDPVPVVIDDQSEDVRGDGTTLSDWPVTILGCDQSDSGRLYRNGSDTVMDLRIRLAPNESVVLARQWQ